MKIFRALGFLCVLWGPTLAIAKDELYTDHKPLTLRIEGVRSIAPETRVGFGKSLMLYAVDALSPTVRYVLYCQKFAPREGADYLAEVDHVTGNYSALKLWPEERASLGIPGKGRLYRVVSIHDMLPGSSRPDVACDVYSEKSLKQ